MGLLTDPFSAGRETGASAAPAYAAERTGNSYAQAPRSAASAMPTRCSPRRHWRRTYEPRWSLWAAGFAGSQTTDGNTALGSNSATSRLFGTAAGADYWFSAHTLAGFALAGGGTSFSVVNGGSGRSDLFQAGAFVRHSNGPAYISAALAYGWQDVTTDRTVTIAGVDRLRAEFNANAWSRPRRRRLSLRHAMGGRRRHHALCGGTVHHLRPSGLCRTGGLRRQHLRAGLWLEERHRHPQRTRPARRQILRHAERGPHLARPRRMGARLQPGSRRRRHLPGAAGRELRRQRRKAGQRTPRSPRHRPR